MRFYTQQHRFYWGIDLHARTLAVCILDHAGLLVCQQTIAGDTKRSNGRSGCWQNAGGRRDIQERRESTN